MCNVGEVAQPCKNVGEVTVSFYSFTTNQRMSQVDISKKYVSRARFDEAVRAWKGVKEILEQERKKWATWAEERRELLTRNNALAEQVSSRVTFHGRNKMRTQDYNSYQLANNKIVKGLMLDIYPYYKFLSPSMTRFDANDPRNLFCRMHELGMEIPEGAIEEIYWGKEVVPMFGKHAQEFRSKGNSRHFQQFESKYLLSGKLFVGEVVVCRRSWS